MFYPGIFILTTFHLFWILVKKCERIRISIMADIAVPPPVALESETSKRSVVKLKNERFVTSSNSAQPIPGDPGLSLNEQISDSLFVPGTSVSLSPNWRLSPSSPLTVVFDDEDILSQQRMESFRAAFPSKALFSQKMLSHLDSIRDDNTRTVFAQSSIATAATPSSATIGDRGGTIKMLRRPSALPDAAESGKLQWRNINIFVGNKDDGNQILHDISGEILSGELLALMGGSGAGIYVQNGYVPPFCAHFDLSFYHRICSLISGKSTFLDALSGRSNLNQLTVEGQLAVNGHKFKVQNQKLIRSLCTYVPQSDVLCPTQTVQEALLFYANLKLASKSEEVRLKRVNYLIDVLHLTSCRHTLIGSESKVCIKSLFCPQRTI